MAYLRVSPVAASEAAGTLNFVVRLDAPSSSEVRVSYDTTSGSATTTANEDLVAQQGTLVFTPGETSKVVQVPLTNDTTAEPTEAFWLELSGAVNAVVEQGLTPALIFDDDAGSATGTPLLRTGDVVVDESAGTADVLVWLDRPSTDPVSVRYATANGSATAGTDYIAASGLLNFAPGEVVKTVSVSLSPDSAAEPDEAFRLMLSNPTNATLTQPDATVLIGGNGAAPVGTPQVMSHPLVIGEGAAFANFVVSLSGPSQNEVRVNFATASGTATAGEDFSSQQGTLVFAPGETTKTVPVLVTNDSLTERSEVFWLNLDTPVNATVPQRSVPAVVIDNDGPGGTPGLSISDTVVDERAQRATLVVSLDRPSTDTVTVAYASSDLNATAPGDYVAANGSLSFAPGEMTKEIHLDIVNDTLTESNESFSVTLSSPTHATLTDSVGQVTIARSDAPAVGTPQILSTPVVVSEADTLVSFNVRLSAPSNNTVQVSYATEAGTASPTDSQDFFSQQGTLVFAPGETQKTVSVLLNDDAVSEGTETFTLTLSGEMNATVPRHQTVATILDNDSTDGGTVFSFGGGNDVYTVTNAFDRIAEGPSGGNDTVRSGISYTLPDNVENLVLTGDAMAAIGNAGDNVFRGTSGDNTFDGREGVDTVVFGDALAAHSVSATSGQITTTSATEGTDILINIERARFTDLMVALDTSPGGKVWEAYAMFNAAFDRGPNTQELSQWTAQLDQLEGNQGDLAQALINTYAPGISNEALVTHLWSTITGTAITPDALNTYVGLLENGTFTQSSLLEGVSALDLNTVELAGLQGQLVILDPTYFPPIA